MRRGRGAISHFSISDFSRMLISVPCVRRPCGASEESHEDGGGLRMREMQVRNHKNSAYIQRERQKQ